jgi:hypothetical protein
MANDKEPKYKDEKAVRVKIGKDIEYIAVVLPVDTSFEVNAGATWMGGGQAGIERQLKNQVLAQYIKDPEMGIIPHDVWAQKKRIEVAGTLSPHMNVPFTSDQIIVSGSKPLITSTCPKCKSSIMDGSHYCHNCGARLVL